MDLPLVIEEGLKEFGTKELAGAANSLQILAWANEVGLKATYTADSVPWCGLFVAVVCHRAGKPVVDGPLWALNWAKWGQPAGQPALGDILVFQREGGGHVGFYIGEDKEAYHVLGGNQGDAVSITRVLKARLFAAREPVYRNRPASATPRVLAIMGVLSTNEA